MAAVRIGPDSSHVKVRTVRYLISAIFGQTKCYNTCVISEGSIPGNVSGTCMVVSENYSMIIKLDSSHSTIVKTVTITLFC